MGLLEYITRELAPGKSKKELLGTPIEEFDLDALSDKITRYFENTNQKVGVQLGKNGSGLVETIFLIKSDGLEKIEKVYPKMRKMKPFVQKDFAIEWIHKHPRLKFKDIYSRLGMYADIYRFYNGNSSDVNQQAQLP